MLTWFRRRVANFESQSRTAEEALKRGDFESARIAYENITKIWPNIAFAHTRHGRALMELGRQAEATAAFERALEIDRNEPEALYHCGLIAHTLGAESEARGFFERAFKPPCPHPEAGLKLASITLAGGSPSIAFELYQRVLELDPAIAEAHYGYGEAAMLLGREREAMDAFRRALTITSRPHPEAGLKLASIALVGGSPSIACELYQRVLDLDPAIAEAHYGYGEAAMLLGREREAMGAFRRAQTIKPELSRAGATAFEWLFQTPSARQPRSARPLICVPLVAAYYRYWLGGQYYLINFASVISTVPKAQRPRLVVAVHCEENEGIDGLRSILDCIFENDAVIGIIDSKAEIILSNPVLERMNRRRNKNGSLTRTVVEDLMKMVDWTFPLLYPLWRVPALPGPLFWIPDLQHRFWPSFFSAEEVTGRNRDMKALATRATPIVFSSRSAQRDFRDHFHDQRCRTHVWHFVSSPIYDRQVPRDRYQTLDLPARFYYTPNQYWRHKDHTTLFRALQRILEEGHEVTFVCTGTDLRTATDEYSRELLMLIESLSLGRHVRLLGVLPRSDQIEVMRHCCAIIQPSLFEGWSTVVEDARALGRPIIASDIPVHREQLGEDATFFSPHDAKSLAATVIALDPTLQPGPAPELEAAALANLKPRTEASAQEFLAILKREAGLRA